jgi:hypothetical protein
VVYPVAIAAGVLLVVGLAGLFRESRLTLPGGLRPDLARAMEIRHEFCATLPDHHRLPAHVDRNNYEQICSAFTSELGYKALVAGLPGDWQFKGAAICPVGTVRSAHLVFVQGDRSVSIFSLRAPEVRGRGDFTAELGKANIAGFADGGHVYVLLGERENGSFSIDELTRMREQLRHEIRTVQASARPFQPTLATSDLMYDYGSGSR